MFDKCKKAIILFLIGFVIQIYSYAQNTDFVFPKNLAVLTNNTVDFQWNYSNLALSYRLQVSTTLGFGTTIVDSTINLTENCSIILNNCNDYYCRVGVYDGTTTFWSTPVLFSVFNPACLSSTIVWFSSDTGVVYDGSFMVSHWQNLVGVDSLKQTNVAAQPIFVSNDFGNYPVIKFDGSNDFMIYNKNVLVSSFFGMMNYDQIGTFSGYSSILSSSTTPYSLYGNSGSTTMFTQNFIGTQFYMNDLSTNNFAPINENKLISVVSNPLSLNDFMISSSTGTGDFWKGNYSEIVMTDTLLSTNDYNKLHSYFYNKYAPPVNLGPNINIAYGYCSYNIDAGAQYTSYLWSTGATTQSISVIDTGTYWVEAVNTFGLASRDTIKVIYPFVSKLLGTVLCQGSTKLWNTNFPKNGYTFQWQDNSTDSIFTITTAGQYWVKITDSLGCYQYSDTVTITVDNFPAIASLGNDTSLCSGNTIYLKSGASQAINYLWNDSSTNDSLAITATGPYWVTVSDINSCSKTDTINIAIAGSAPTGNFSNTSTCIGNSTSFNDLSIPPGGDVITNWLWNFGDPASGVNDTSSLQNPIHIYADTGSYTVNLLVTTNAGCGAVVAKTINVYPNPQINFTTSNLCENSNSQFIGQAVTFGYPITQWSWDFGDPSSGANNISGLQSPVHVFVSASTYTVQLIAQNIHGCADTANQNIVIGQLPVADFTSSVACKNSSVTFTDNSILPPSTSILATTWNFGDNGTSTLLNPSHIYSSNVNYNVTHTITASNGCKDTVIKTISVYPVPYAYFNANNICVNTLGDFNDLSVGLGGTIINWLWDFGSADTSMTQNAKYAYTSVGNKNVKLVITTAQGCKDSITKTIVVNPLPVANYTYTPAIGTIPLVVNFTNTSSGALSYVWDFGDSTQSTLIDPSHTFLSAITYSISLTAKNSFGCENTVVKTISPLEQYLDVAILDVSVSTQNNFLNITAKIANTGNTDVTKMELYVNVQNGSMLKENWTGLLKAANIINYNINSSLYLGDEKKYDYVCVSAVLPNGVDDMISENNELCEALDESQFKVLDVYPNPSKDVLIIPFIIPAEKFLTITIYDINGKVVREAFSGYLTKGLQEVVINTLEMTSGIYACKIVHEDQTIIKKFIKH